MDWAKLSDQAVESRAYLSTGVREIIQNWLGRISTPAAELLLAAAVLGQQATFDHLCHVAGLEEMQAATALDELFVKQLLLEADEASLGRDQTPAYIFSHQKLAEVAYSEAGAARRRILHRRAFEVLRATAAPSAELAYHALHADLTTETVQYSIIAGNEAMRLFAVRVAIIHYETAWQWIEQKIWPEAVSGADRQESVYGPGPGIRID